MRIVKEQLQDRTALFSYCVFENGCDTAMKEEVYWVALHKLWETMQNNSRVLRELQQTITGEALWKASSIELEQFVPYLSAEYRKELLEQRRTYDLSKIENYLLQNQIQIILYRDAAYPQQLKEIHQPPAMLYCKGHFPNQPLQIAMVGSRKGDRYGLEVAEKIASEFSFSNVPVVSGLARGIDAAAHKGAILYQGGTIAVQGCGIDQIYPKENKKLAEAILAHENSCIISEFPIGSQPIAWHFPMRNRIISGLAQGVVIVQAARKSGAYITVETALEQGRDVFAVPGQIYNPLSEGPHQLLQEGAQLVTCADDVLASYGVQKEAKKKNKMSGQTETMTMTKEQQMIMFEESSSTLAVDLSEQESRVLNLFTSEPLSIEEAAYLAKIPVSELMAILSMLELYGLIAPMVGRKYIRIG